jgi:Flp pilus assembly protein TadD
LKAHPNNDSPYNSLGVIYKKLGKIQEALSYF